MKIKSLFCLVIATLAILSCSHDYESVANDPMETRIYTLDNGLKVYLTVNKDQPRIQTYIAVRVGGKNDPSETTGLSHYLEHVMFKGTTHFGTSNYEAEKPLLDKIENLYEVYRTTTDVEKRKAIYHEIDSISNKASKYAIANEYDKLMASIGSIGSNAYTSDDVTCYIEDIPSNQVENWAKVQSDRFMNMVIRGFHTELEAVYEEYNIHLTDDMDKVWETIGQILFPNHPYGKQTVIGQGEHLKNPSIKNIKNHFAKWYVPNNVAICMSGNLDFDETINIIKQYFGEWKSNPDLESQRAKLDSIPMIPLTSPVKKTIYGQEAEKVILAWGCPGEKSLENEYIQVISNLLSNGKAGLFDIDINQAQKVLEVGCGVNGMTDFAEFITLAVPKEGQTLDEAKDIMLEEIEKLKSGNFDEKLLESIINNTKLDLMRELEDNSSRASMFVNAFVNGTDWKDEVEKIDRLSKITKQDIVDYANKYLTDGYACIYKCQGVDPNIKKIEKPAISPIEMNRNLQSQFVKNVVASEVRPIEPVFVDYKKDMTQKSYNNGDELLYKENTTNETFMLQFRIEHGSKADKCLPFASDFIAYLGTDKMTSEELQTELYHLACDASISVTSSTSLITISGLAENMSQALELCMNWVKNAQSDETIFSNLVRDELKSRADAKFDQRTCFNKLRMYGCFGQLNEATNIMSAKELNETDPQILLDKLSDLLSYKKTIVYYGPLSIADIEHEIDSELKASNLKDGQYADIYPTLPTATNEIILAPYDAKNIYMMGFSDNGEIFDPTLEAQKALFNEYFGEGMNGVVFQELREARGLAYSAAASYNTPAYKGQHNTFYSYIITQNDKMMDAYNTFCDIIENTPESENSFTLAKDAVVKRLSTERTIRDGVLSSYIVARHLGLDHDIAKDIYENVKNMTLQDIMDFQKKHVKGRAYRYLILGNESELDIKSLEKIAPIKRVSLEEIFGY